MGMNFGNNQKKAISEINVTPLVDVMLVLLVIFMITAPLMLNGIKLELPKTKEVNPMQLSSSQIVLSYTKKGQLFLGEKLVDESKVVGQILAGFKSDNQNILYLRADYSMPYGKVAKLMSFLKRGGVSNIALVTEMEERKK